MAELHPQFETSIVNMLYLFSVLSVGTKNWNEPQGHSSYSNHQQKEYHSPPPRRKDIAPLPHTDEVLWSNSQWEREKEMLTRPFSGDVQQANQPISPLLKQAFLFSSLDFHDLLLWAQMGILGLPASSCQSGPLELKILQSEKFRGQKW